MKSLNDYLPERHRIRKTARALVYKDGKFLIMRRTRRLTTGELYMYLSIPGGGIESGETPETAATREVQEETGIDVAPEHLVIVQKLADGCMHHYVWCKYISGEPHLDPRSEEAKIQSTDNHFDPVWLPAQEVTADALHPEYADIAEVLPKLIKANGRVEGDEPITL